MREISGRKSEDRRPKFGLTLIIVYLLIQTYFIKVKMTSVFPTLTLNFELFAIYHLYKAVPQVQPAPTAAKSKISPVLNSLLRCTSSNNIGIVPPEVLA